MESRIDQAKKLQTIWQLEMRMWQPETEMKEAMDGYGGNSQKKTGYQFNDHMCEPFTYSSHNKRDVKCRNGHFTISRWFTYEKLQFVGITILGVTILDCLWDIGHKW